MIAVDTTELNTDRQTDGQTDQGSRFQEFHRYMELKILIGTNLVIFFGGGTFVLKKVLHFSTFKS